MTTLTCALGPDCAGTVLTQLLGSASRSIDCAVYEIGGAYRWLFARAAARGVRARVLLDAHAGDGNRETAAAVTAAGGECRLMPPASGRGHWKLMVVDDRRVAVGTGNLIWRDAPRDQHGRLPPEAPPLSGTREWWTVVSDAPAVSATAALQFARAWSQARPAPAAWTQLPAPPVGTPVPEVAPLVVDVDPGRVRLVSGGPAIARVSRSLIASSHERAFVIAPYVYAGATVVRELLSELVAAGVRGSDARLLLGRAASGRDAGRLSELGPRVAVMEGARSTTGHAKGVVADGEVLIGSANWSGAGLSSAWEAALLIEDGAAAAYFAGAYLRDWSAATTPTVSIARRGGILGVT